MNLPDGWTESWIRGCTDANHDARADIDYYASHHYVIVTGPNHATKAEAERDLERMVWALEGEDIAMVRADRDRALARAALTEQALTAARAEIADLRLAAERRDARERARHPVVRRIAHALFVLRGVE